MSFHVPRKPGGSPQICLEEEPPKIPPKARARAHTSPNVEKIKERIASAMIEADKLQKEIDSVVERQSIYAASSRPSTSHSMALVDMEPMPSIPALPPSAPSFAERVSPSTDRPQTAPAMPVRIPHRATTFAEASAAFITPPPSREGENTSPPPPLPLVLRPPLRKKKSFSRVSSWLLGPQHQQEQHQQHQRDISLDSVTNIPRPVKGREGFYQCVAPPVSRNEQSRKCSFDTVSTISTWATGDEEQSVPTTTWSPGSTSLLAKKQHGQKEQRQQPLLGSPPGLERVTTFGKVDVPAALAPKKGTVGVAF